MTACAHASACPHIHTHVPAQMLNVYMQQEEDLVLNGGERCAPAATVFGLRAILRLLVSV